MPNSTVTPFDCTIIRNQFPALSQKIHDNPLVYLDSAATTQKPQVVLDAITRYYSGQNASVHRGSHYLAAKATTDFEGARETVRQFINASSNKEVIWTRGATEAINLVAQSYGRSTLKAGDEILVSELEHHANIVPWQQVAQQTGAVVIKIPMLENCTLDMDAFYQRLNNKTKIVAVGHVSNVTATENPIKEIIDAAHNVGAIAVIDGAQAVAHHHVDVQALDADFYLFSGHKIFAPTGTGVLYGKQELLEAMPPWHGGGKMVDSVSFEETIYAPLPAKFEAGTPNVAGALALATAINWLESLDRQGAEAHINQLRDRALERVKDIDGMKIIGLQPNSCLFSFIIEDVSNQDIATLLDQQGIALRVGHHCAHPMMHALNIKGTIRVSFAIYNNQDDVEQFVTALEKALSIL
ncbi:SufS family cysteine desulfurase [Vibrio sp. SS-MA-C1-2]|uniref:aminotransferase class V-fold PLP-dependent enzyme n=1 Tax=Vibrio sp. SS-MA-C1-2 TaxID=2908646 RepID=UPI001F427BEC|nr:SufS family cysteine desulfurase [Vibrio sp. SS-MA-C1-2]UJF18919.1 SufS family cysteine desulfurase [Vibrio sp. SS-MA-C1-2]